MKHDAKHESPRHLTALIALAVLSRLRRLSLRLSTGECVKEYFGGDWLKARFRVWKG